MRRGRFITFEGTEGSGKTSQVRRAVEALAARGLPVVATREPGGTTLGEVLRSALLDPANHGMDPRAELLLYCADRAEHTTRVIAPALARGEVVICDRYGDATVAYQGHGRALGAELVRRTDLGRMAPDLTIVLDLPAALSLERAQARNQSQALDRESRFEQEALAFHERVRLGYLAIAAAEPERVKVVDAARPPGEVFAEVLAHLLTVTRDLLP